MQEHVNHARRELYGRKEVCIVCLCRVLCNNVFRNAAKARTKDVTTRAQKGHFGRKRLEILSHGLTIGNQRSKVFTQSTKPGFKEAMSSMAFSHAKCKQPQSPGGGYTSRLDATLYTPESKTSSYECGSTARGSSKVIEALDSTQRPSTPLAICSISFLLASSNIHQSTNEAYY